jgi:hypothetical protein
LANPNIFRAFTISRLFMPIYLCLSIFAPFLRPFILAPHFLCAFPFAPFLAPFHFAPHFFAPSFSVGRPISFSYSGAPFSFCMHLFGAFYFISPFLADFFPLSFGAISFRMHLHFRGAFFSSYPHSWRISFTFVAHSFACNFLAHFLHIFPPFFFKSKGRNSTQKGRNIPNHQTNNKINQFKKHN